MSCATRFECRDSNVEYHAHDIRMSSVICRAARQSIVECRMTQHLTVVCQMMCGLNAECRAATHSNVVRLHIEMSHSLFLANFMQLGNSRCKMVRF